MSITMRSEQLKTYFSILNVCTTNKTRHYIQVCSGGGVIIHPYHFQGEYPNELFARVVGDYLVSEEYINESTAFYTWKDHPECDTAFGNFGGKIFKGNALIFRRTEGKNTGMTPREIIGFFDLFHFNPFYDYALAGVMV